MQPVKRGAGCTAHMQARSCPGERVGARAGCTRRVCQAAKVRSKIRQDKIRRGHPSAPLPPRKFCLPMAFACSVSIAAAAAATPFKHAPLPPLLVELRDTLAGPGLRDALADLRPLAGLRRRSHDALRTLTVVDTALHAATMGTVTGLEVLCGSIRTCHSSVRSVTSRTPQLKTGRAVCALCAGARRRLLF
jgi:hypothetical protein